MTKNGSENPDEGQSPKSQEMQNLEQMTKKLLKVSKSELEKREAEDRKRKADS